MAKTTKKLTVKDYVGRYGLFEVPRTTMLVQVKVMNAQERFGRLDLKITPISGEGDTWVSSEAVTLLKG